MEKIIGLYGHGNCGKSKTLNLLKEILRKEGKSISKQPHPNCEKAETFLWNEKIVCVAPAGDDSCWLQSNIAYFKEKQCDIAVSATRSKGETVRLLNDFAKENNLNVEWFNKSREYHLSKETQQACNHEFAEVLMSEIKLIHKIE